MKKITVIALLLAAALGAQARNGSGKPAYKDAGRPVEERVSDLLSRMTLEEKVMQLNQYTLGRNDNANNVADPVDKIPAEIGSLIYFDTSPGLRNRLQKKAIEQSRLGIPVLFGYDVIHGFRTTYPISLAQACSWNPALVKQAAEVAAQEARMSGVEWTFSPMIDVARDGRWGRVSEGYGEDPYANAVYGVAAVEGYQGDNLADSRRVAACLKHFVGYGASEAGRDYVYTEISRQTLWDTYMPPYQAGIEAGAATVMSCFNDISGTPGTANPYILTEVLKERWAHDGFVVSDWAAIEQLRSQGVAAELAQTGKPLVLVLSSGRPLELCRLEPLCGAMVQMWQPGIRGGNPLAGILSGRINPSGRLAMTFPRSTGQIPIYYNRRQSGRTHQGKYQDIPSTPLYEFGHGLSYTTFEYGDLRPSATTLRRGEKVTVEVSVTNTGGMDGAETVHWFISDPVCRISRPVRELKHFEKQPIRRGETRTFRFEIDPEKDLSFTDGDGNRFLEPGDYFILVKDKKVKLTLTD